MVSSENILNITTTKQAAAAAAVSSRGLENNQNNPAAAGNNHRKTARQQPQQDHQEQQPQALKCPRCDSPNTKFCYYNNYSLTQPRHFCKTCRRYWTKGGALRNVPIGGGCRKNKKLKSSSNSRLSDSSKDSGCSSSNDIGGFKFFHGLSPAMDFQLAGLSFPRLNIVDTNNNPSPFYSLFGSGDAATSNPASSFSQLDFPSSGFNYHQLPCVAATNNTFSTGAIQEPSAGSLIANHDSLASSIESLSSINQDLHWRLQQQRLAMLFGGGGEDNNNNDNNKKDSPINNNTSLASAQKPQPILFQNLEISSPSSSKDHQEASLLSAVGNNSRNREGASCAGGLATAATEWFFGNSYAAPAPVTAACTTPTVISNNDNTTIGNWNVNGVQAWSDLHRCSTLP